MMLTKLNEGGDVNQDCEPSLSCQASHSPSKECLYCGADEHDLSEGRHYCSRCRARMRVRYENLPSLDLIQFRREGNKKSERTKEPNKKGRTCVEYFGRHRG